MMNEMGVSSHKGKLKISCLHITWLLAVVIFGVRRVRFKIYMYTIIVLVNSDAIIILLKVMYRINHSFMNVHLIIIL